MTTQDLKDRIEAERAADVPGTTGAVCTLVDRCRCPMCATTEVLLRSTLVGRGFNRADRRRVSVRANDFSGAAHPYLASVRVDGREVYRIHARPDEVFGAGVMDDIVKALRRPS